MAASSNMLRLLTNREDDNYLFGGTQQVVLAIVPIVTGLLSVLGSSFIVYIILTQDRRRKLKNSYHRLVLAVSCSDIISSLNMATSTFLMPADTPGVWAAMGTVESCEVQGFFMQLGMATTIYMACLAIYFLLQIRQSSHLLQGRQSTPRAVSRRTEILFHAVPITFAVLTSFAGVVLKVYNAPKLGIGCWVATYPMDCKDPGSEHPCERGASAPIFVWLFGGLVVIVTFVIVVFCMLAIYLTVRKQVLKVEEKYAFGSQSSRRRLEQTAVQGCLYITSFILTYVWVSCNKLLELGVSSYKASFFLSLMSQVFYPLQGFMNFGIYVRPRYQELRKQYPKDSWFESLRRVLDASENKRNDKNRYTARRAARRFDNRRDSTGYESTDSTSPGGSTDFFATASRMFRPMFQRQSSIGRFSSQRSLDIDDAFDFDYVSPEDTNQPEEMKLERGENSVATTETTGADRRNNHEAQCEMVTLSSPPVVLPGASNDVKAKDLYLDDEVSPDSAATDKAMDDSHSSISKNHEEIASDQGVHGDASTLEDQPSLLAESAAGSNHQPAEYRAGATNTPSSCYPKEEL